MSPNGYRSCTCQKLRTESYAVVEGFEANWHSRRKRLVVGGDEVAPQLSQLKGQMNAIEQA